MSVIRLIQSVFVIGLAGCILTSCSISQETTRTNQQKMISQRDYELMPKDTIGTPTIIFAEPLHDFGTVEKGALKKFDFVFTNTGDADLVIELASACTCTSIDWPRQPIPPGARGTIPITFDSNQKDGEVTIDVDVIANTDPIVTIAQFKANVITVDE